ncbi:MAG: cobyrinate a,c-diamide synthase [Gammaproteobacteria bacterium]
MPDTKSSQCLATLVAAPASGQGKTILCAALARKWKNEGKQVQLFKIGPDYLDPTILEQASGQSVYNIDLWIMGEQHCRRLLARAASRNDIVLIESAMGLHDNNPSNAQLARLFNLPVSLIIDAAKYAQTSAAIIEGLSQYGVGANIQAVVGNKIGSDNHDQLLRETIGSKYAGSIRRDPRMLLPERHLGLVQAADIDGLDRQLDLAAGALTEFDISIPLGPVVFDKPAQDTGTDQLLLGRTIAIARDAAFSFIYPVNIEILKSMGASLVYFSPLANHPVPQCDALWLPGGYPELHLAELAEADTTRASIITHHQSHKPVLAECGGLMYLCKGITDRHGTTVDTCGLFDAKCEMRSRFQSVGLHAVDYGQGEIRGHSLHHSFLITEVSAKTYSTRQDGNQGEAVYRLNNMTLSYMHHYFASSPSTTAALFT